MSYELKAGRKPKAHSSKLKAQSPKLKAHTLITKERRMKKFTLKIIVLLVFLGVSVSQGSVRVTTTTTDLASLVQIIGGNLVDVTSLSRPLQDAHYLDATPGMIMRISRSDLFVENGFEL